MLPIAIDISPILAEYSALADSSEEFSSFILDNMVDDFMFSWQEMVKSELHGTREEYMRYMSTERIDSRNAVIRLLPSESNLAMMIEDGASSFDEKEGFANSLKKHEKKDGGWYLTIPLRHATTEAIGESMTFSGVMPDGVQKAVKASGGGALRTEDLPAEYQKIGINKTSGYIHKSNIYEGIARRQIGSTKSENRGGYMSFRRVSDTSEDGSWIHPGFKAKNFMDRAASKLEENIGKILDDATKRYLDKLLG